MLEFSDNTLHSIEEWRRALIMLSGLFQGYMWQEGEAGLPSKMPSILAVPFHDVSNRIGTPPVVTYASTVVYNWRLRDPEKPMTLENLCAIVNHTGTEDESWFYMVCVLVELKAVPALKAILEALAAQEEGNNRALVQSLASIESAIGEMKFALNRMRENCKPKTFYVEMRPYFTGSKHDAMPDGMVYEGVDTKPQKFIGASAAQSAAVKAIDIYLGIQHVGEHKEFLETMKDYLPSKHREFLQYLSQQPPLRQYVAESHQPELIKQFNATIHAFADYRSDHLKIVTSYIVNQMKHSVNPSLEERGTGGTSLMEFLQSVRNQTKEYEIRLLN